MEYDSELVMPGGQVASTVVACQTWGLSTRYVGKLGDDDAARLHAREFARMGVEGQLIHVPGATSARSLILVDRRGERTVLCRRDERVTLRPEELKREWIVNARALHVDGHDTAAATLAAGWARAAGVPVVADLDEIYPGVDALIEKIDYLVVSRDFPGRLTGESNLKTALREIQARYGCAADRGDAGTRRRAGVGRTIGFIMLRRTACRWSTRRGQEISFMQDLFMGYCRGGRWSGSLISPALRQL